MAALNTSRLKQNTGIFTVPGAAAKLATVIYNF